MTDVRIVPRANLSAEVAVPGSKSCTARALIMAALTEGTSTLLEPADCDDSNYMVDGLRGFGLSVAKEPDRLVVEGGNLRQPDGPLFLGNSGTAVRFLVAASAALSGRVVLDGVERMRQRPIADLVNAMRAWGIQATSTNGCPPVAIESTGQFGGSTAVAGSASSQYLSGLLMAAPRASKDVSIAIIGDLVSKPYVDLTMAMMAERGVTIENRDYTSFHVRANQQYASGSYTIEADASGASYFLAAAAIAGGRVRVKNLSFRSRQGDAQFARVLQQMGCSITEGPDWLEAASGPKLDAVTVDLNAMPDMAQTLAVTALFAKGTTSIRNIANLRIKETDRIAATARELRKLGAKVEELDDGWRITPGVLRAAAIDTYDDHRMAMCFALAGLRIPGVVIRNAECVSKTFPDFFDRMERLT